VFEAGMISRHLEYCRKYDEQLSHAEVMSNWETVDERGNEEKLNLTPKKEVFQKVPALCVILHRQNSKEPEFLMFENMEDYSLFFMENNIFRCCGFPYFNTVEGEKSKNVEAKPDVVQPEVKIRGKRRRGNLKRKRQENEENEDAETRCPSQESDEEMNCPQSTTRPQERAETPQESDIVYKVKGITHEPRNRKLPYRTRILHKCQIFFEAAFKTKEEAEEAVKREYKKLKKNPFTVIAKKNEQQKENKVYPKSNVMGVQFVKSSFAYPWIYTFQRNKKSIQKSFKTQEEAEKAALAFHKTFGTAQGVSDVKGVYFIKNPMLKRPWKVRVV
jgi:hypothetical protein